MEQCVVVLCSVALIVTWVLLVAGLFVLVVAVRVVKRRGGQRTRFYGSPECGLAHFTTRFGLLGNEAVFIIFGTDLGITVSVRIALSAKSQAVCCCTSSSVCDSNKGDNCANDDGRLTGTASTDQWVALMIIGLHSYSGHGEVGAVNGYNGRLGETSARVYILYRRVNRSDGRDQEQDEVDLWMSVISCAGTKLDVP